MNNGERIETKPAHGKADLRHNTDRHWLSDSV